MLDTDGRLFKSPAALCQIFTAMLCCFCVAVSARTFEVDNSPPPSTHHPIAPPEGAAVSVNPPSIVWREDKSAETYIIEFSPTRSFPADASLIRVQGVDLPFYNHNRTLAPGQWYWRYFVVRKDGAISNPSPVRSFVVPVGALEFPVPSPEETLVLLPEHPRIFVTPQTLPAFQRKREYEAASQWATLKRQADTALRGGYALRGKQVPLHAAKIKHSADSRSHAWKPGQPVRRQVFLLDGQGELFWLPDNTIRILNRAAARLNILSLAWQISSDPQYLEGAKQLIALLAPLRLDAHLGEDLRSEHDTVVYAYEQGVKAMALAFDRLYHELDAETRAALLAHIEYHVQDAGNWLKKQSIHTVYQKSHQQQCMHTLLVTVLATAGDSAVADQWVRYIVPQYMNRIAWTSEDGGYFEGQTYGHKFADILEGLAALKTATGVDLFRKPEIYNAGRYWLYAMNLNYWFNHWGDNYSLIWPHANPRDAYITAFLAEMTADPYVKWYADTILTNPDVSPFDYLSAGPLQARPPVDIAQAELFPLTGVVAAYNGLYDHGSARIFFRSSRWGSHSHAHADQNAFVIHDGGEILAPDTGYYTYSGADYHYKWSKSTFAHNSLLVNGEPQPLGIESSGEISAFFNGARLTYFVGDASQAYAAPLETFRRAVLYVRPNTYILYDELAATAPSTFSWLMNLFEPPQIDREAKSLLIGQQQMRLRVDTLLPERVTYSINNERPYPVKQEELMWSRITETFPQPWHLRIENAEPLRSSEFLTLMQSWDASSGEQRETVQRTINTATTIGLCYTGAGQEGVVLFRRKLEGGERIRGESLKADAQAAALFRTASGVLSGWFVAKGRELHAGRSRLFRSDVAVSASMEFDTPAAAALLHIGEAQGRFSVRLEERPRQLLLAPPSRPQQGVALAFTWDTVRSEAIFELEGGGAAAVWVNPHVDMTVPLAAAELQVTDTQGSYVLPLQAGWMADGRVMYFAEVMPREIGRYTVVAEGDGASTSSLFVQDRWEPYRGSRRGMAEVVAEIREGSWLYFSTVSSEAIRFRATLVEQLAAGQIDNLLFNGDFEAGIPGYPPRGWTLAFERGESATWSHWTQADAHGGKSALHHVRDRNDYELLARPLRLLRGGTYHLRFYAKGTIGNAFVMVQGRGGSRLRVPIEPSEQWRLYEASVDLPAGYTTLKIVTPAGTSGEDLWVDDMALGLIPNPVAKP